MRINNKTLTSGIWAYVFLVILLEPAAMKQFTWTNRFYLASQAAFIGVVAVMVIGDLTRFRFNIGLTTILMVVYYIYLIGDTYINNGRTKALLQQAIQFLGFAVYLDILLKNNPEELFKSVLNILTFYVLLNCVIVFALEHGLYETNYYSNNYLLGYDNQNINFILPTMVLVLLKNFCYRKSPVQLFVTYIASWLTAIKIWSGMTLVVTALMTGVAFLYYLTDRKKPGKAHSFGKIFNFLYLLIADIAANIGLVVMRIQYYFEFIIVDILHRNLTLTNRTIIWDKTFEFIKKKPWFGYGREEYTLRAVKYGFKEKSPVGLHSHNRFLETIYSGGIVLFVLFMFILFYAAVRLFKVREHRFAQILSLGMFIYLIGMLTEYYDYCLFFWGFLIIADNAESIIRKLDQEGRPFKPVKFTV